MNCIFFLLGRLHVWHETEPSDRLRY